VIAQYRWIMAPLMCSPQITGAAGVILELKDTGFHSTGTNLQVSRRLGAHAYLDEV
jgi:hypothetical protein